MCPKLLCLICYDATVVIDPLSVPMHALLVMLYIVFSPASLPVQPFKAIALAPITNTSSAFVAALAAAIVHLNVISFVPVPDT